MESGVYQSRRPVRPYVCYPHGYQARIQSSLKVQDGISFFFKMESAWPVPFLPHNDVTFKINMLKKCFPKSISFIFLTLV